ncbi:MAG: threonine/homoserine/homoserine lactone efflux protein [Moritella dasanensis]|jgi:threonine/homoserine/homoserine lactone efflux protein
MIFRNSLLVHSGIVAIFGIIIGMVSVVFGSISFTKNEVTWSDLGVWIGSLATMATLVFLTYQQVRSSKRQQELDKKQKNKEQKQDFYEALESLESNNSVQFTNKFYLYHLIANHRLDLKELNLK